MDFRKLFKTSWVASLLLPVLVASSTGCETSKIVTERFTVAPEINMAGREVVIVEGIRGDSIDRIVGPLKEALMAKGFQVLDRGAAIQRRGEERGLGGTGQMEEGDQAKIASADIIIQGSITRHDGRDWVEDGGRRYANRMEYQLYERHGEVNVKVNFDVIDFHTTKIITSTVIASTQTGATSGEIRPPSIDMGSIYELAYNDVVNQFMKKIAPFDVIAEHEVYPVKNVPETNSGIALLSSNPAAAMKEFEAGLRTAAALPKPNPHAAGQITHNMGVAAEMSGQFDLAVAKYTEAARLDPKLKENDVIVRARQRKANVAKLRDHGITG